MNKTRLSIFTMLFTLALLAQDKKDMKELPYYEVPDYYDSYTAGTVAARMVDGLGFRYRWATEDLREEDLNYKPSDDARTTLQTIDHILGLSRVIVNATLKKPTDFTQERTVLTYEEKRIKTLNNFQQASENLRKVDDLEDFNLDFIGKNGKRSYPFWNNINGPIADAIWHCGQVVSFRRASGNPLNSKVSFLRGKVSE